MEKSCTKKMACRKLLGKLVLMSLMVVGMNKGVKVQGQVIEDEVDDLRVFEEFTDTSIPNHESPEQRCNPLIDIFINILN